MAPIVALCFVLLAPGLAFAQGFTRVSVPIPVEIDGPPVHCQLYFKVEMKSYNVAFDQFAAGPLDKAQTMFATAVQAIRKQDTQKFASVWTSPDEMKSRSGASVKMADESVANWIKVARNNFDFDHLTVVAEVLLGPDAMFVFDSATRGGIQRYALYVGRDQQDRERLSAVGSGAPLELMVLNSFVAARTAPEFKPVQNLNLRYQYPIPLGGKVDSGAHPVFFEFDGQPMDFPVMNDKVKAPMPALAFLRQVNEAFASAKYDEGASYFTERSQSRLKEWIASMENQRARERQANPAAKPQPLPMTPVSPANVKFVMNAEPLFLVFQAPGVGSAWKPASLTYSYILHQGGDYKIANFAFSSTLDDFLQSPLFDRNILKPVPQKAPGAKPKPGAVATKAAPAKH